MLGKYEVPKHLTKEARALLTGMLTVDPRKRMGIPEIRRSELMQKYAPQDPLQEKNLLQIDPEVLTFAAKNNDLEENALDQQLSANRHNNATTHYYLLVQRKLKGLSIQDITPNKQMFNRRIASPVKDNLK